MRPKRKPTGKRPKSHSPNSKGRTESIPSPAKEKVRLNKFIAQAGVCSRREADELIKEGKIKVNKKVVTEMGYQVQPGDHVYYQGKELSRERLVYLLLNLSLFLCRTYNVLHLSSNKALFLLAHS